MTLTECRSPSVGHHTPILRTRVTIHPSSTELPVEMKVQIKILLDFKFLSKLLQESVYLANWKPDARTKTLETSSDSSVSSFDYQKG